MSEKTNSLASKLSKSIIESPYYDSDANEDDILKGLLGVIDGMSDDEVKEYIFTNGQYYKQMIPAALKDIPQLRTLVYSEPSWGEKPSSYSKLFGLEDVSEEDFLRNFDNIPYDQIEFVAESKGLNPKTLMKDIREKQVQQLRKDVAEGYGEDFVGKVRNKAANLFFPNIVEGAVMEGRDPTKEEIWQDVGTNIAYAVPWNRLPGTGKLINTAKNAAAPTVQEVLNEALAEEDKNRDLGEHATGVGIGTAINAVTPYILKRAFAKTARFLGGEEKGKVAESAKEQVKKELDAVAKKEQELKRVKQKFIDVGGDNSKMTPKESATMDNFEQTLKDVERMKDPTIRLSMEIAAQNGKSFGEKVSNLDKNTRNWFYDLPDWKQFSIQQNVERQFPNTFDAPGNMSRAILNSSTVDGAESWGTNKFGDFLYKDDPTKMPFGIGRGIKALGLSEGKEDKERREVQERKEKAKKQAEKKYKGKLTRKSLEGE